MNERIRELAEQAMQYAKERLEQTHQAGPDFVNDFREKFAELIVRECSKVNNQYVGWRIGDIDLDMVYKEHFGVEL